MELEFESRPTRPGSLLWSEDNILALVTPSIINIFAIPLEEAFGSQGATKAILTSTPGLKLDSDRPPWELRLDAFDLRSTVSPLQLDYLLAAWSPTGCSPSRGCILAAVTTRHSVYLYVPDAMPLDRQWKKSVVLDECLKELWEASTMTSPEIQDKLETMALAWTPKILIHGIGSILTLGNKAGFISLWDATDPQNVQCIHKIRLSEDAWVIQLSYSPWMINDGKHETILAYALSDGKVNAVRVSFNSKSPLVDVKISDNLMKVGAETLHPCTVLSWSPTLIEAPEVSNMLSFNKHNRVYVWSPDNPQQLLSWRMPLARTVASLIWNERNDALLVFFMDGKHGVLRMSESKLETDETCMEIIREAFISKCHTQAKTNVEDDENEDDNEDDDCGNTMSSKLQLHIVAGSRSVHGSLLSIVYYVGSPYQMSFQREKFQSSTIAFPQSPTRRDSEKAKFFLKRVELSLGVPGIALTSNPSAFFWDLLLCIAENIGSRDGAFTKELIRVLQAPKPLSKDKCELYSKRQALTKAAASPEEELARMIFEAPSLNAARASVYVRSQLQTNVVANDIANALSEVVIVSENKLEDHQIYCILNLFLVHSDKTGPVALEEQDRTFLLVLADSALLFHSDNKDLLALAEKVYATILLRFPVTDVIEQMAALKDIKSKLGWKLKKFSSGRESCPACDANVKLEYQDHATCANGHTWPRCAASMLVVSEFRPRTCQCCGRKALKSPSTRSPKPLFPDAFASTWLGITLRAAQLCGFCGGRFSVALRKKE